jgi:hypothetical protein
MSNPDTPPTFLPFNEQVGEGYDASVDVYVRPPFDGDLSAVNGMLSNAMSEDPHQTAEFKEIGRVGDGQHARITIQHGLAPKNVEPQQQLLNKATETLRTYIAAIATGDVEALGRVVGQS